MDEARSRPVALPSRGSAFISPPSSDGNGEATVRALDRAFVRRAQEGDREAFDWLYRTHHPGVFRMVRFALGDLGDPQDAAAETFARAWAALPRYRDTGAP